MRTRKARRLRSSQRHLCVAGAELVVVGDDRRRLDPDRAARAAAAAARGRRPRGRGRTRPGSRRPAASSPAGSPGRRRRAAGTSPAGGASASGRPWPPAQTMPVKWTGLPAELIVSPSPSATSACQAAQPRPSTQGRRIASPKPGCGAASGLRMTSRSPLRLRGAGVAAAGEAAVAAGRHDPRRRRQLAHDLGACRRRSRCRRRSARRRRPARRAGREGSGADRRGCSRRRSGLRASGAPTRRLFGHPRRCDRLACWNCSYLPFFFPQEAMFSLNLLVVLLLAVLSPSCSRSPAAACAGVDRVDEEALLAALHVEDELAHRHVRHRPEDRLQAAGAAAADHAAQLDVHLAA